MLNKGFTLIELLTVVLIVSILTSVAIPQYNKVVARGRVSEAQTMLRVIYDTSDRLAGEFGYRTYEKLLEAKGLANEKDYSFGRTDMFDSSNLPRGCYLPNANNGTLLKCKRFSYKISVLGDDGKRYVAAKMLSGTYANTYLLLDRATMQLSCQASEDTCDIFAMNTNAGANIAF